MTVTCNNINFTVKQQCQGRPAFVHSSFRSAQLPLICTICVERPSVWTEEQRH